jgi:DNA-binding MarR family transcriptional regulator
MTARVAQLLAELSILGVTVVPDGGRLRLSPRSALTAELLERIRELKPEILSVLAAVASSDLLPWSAGLSRAEWRVLAALASGAPLATCQLISATGLDRPALSRALGTLRGRREVVACAAERFRALIN